MRTCVRALGQPQDRGETSGNAAVAESMDRVYASVRQGGTIAAPSFIVISMYLPIFEMYDKIR